LSDRRLIEVAFPLKQASLDSVREKYGPRGHITGFHLWPARRPLAASRAALIATLLPDPGDEAERDEILERLGGKVKTTVKTRQLPNGQVEEIIKEETEGGILRWGRESNPDLDWFRDKIGQAYDGRAPRVLDPFAGGGAIPLEAMRLGCEATAVDINPVAWFILKCTLEYPQRLAGQTRPLPEFVLKDRDFMEGFLKAKGFSGAALREQLEKLGFGDKNDAPQMLPGLEMATVDLEADLAWHVRAWGKWVLDRAREDLEPYYPSVDGKTTVAYLWARTVTCKNCRAKVPLLKTRWLARRGNKRVVLTMKPNADRNGVVFGIDHSPSKGKDVGQGTMSRAGATCPCCSAIMTMADIRVEGHANRLGTMMTAVVVDGDSGKEYRLPTAEENEAAVMAEEELELVFAGIPLGLPDESLPSKEALGFRVPLYGFDKWRDIFTPRQLLALGTFVKHIRTSHKALKMYPEHWVEAIGAYLATSLDRLVDHSTSLATWYLPGENVKHTFVRYALPIRWDFAESNTIYEGGGSWSSAITFSTAALEHTLEATSGAPPPTVIQASAIDYAEPLSFDLVFTDPPYYDAIPYSDLMDVFYIWLKRSTYGLAPPFNRFAENELSPKWDHETSDGELIDDSSRHGGDTEKSKAVYEEGMFRAFQTCYEALRTEGRFVIVFAHKQPDAWEALVSAMIRAGFVVTASWPIQTENVTRSRARASAALASSVWLVCKKRPATARPGWDNRVLAEMRENIVEQLHTFWDAGIRGPDFVWAATGPALEAYSQYPVVKKANEPGQVMTVGEFLGHVRRMVVDFVVGRVLSGDGVEAVAGLDDVTTYYLLHRHDFGMAEAPAGAAILYAISCNLSDRDLVDRYDLLEQRGSSLRLLPWTRRKQVGYDPVLDAPESQGAEAVPLPGLEAPEPELRELPLIDQVHRLMHLWRAGDVTRVNAYLDARGLRRSPLFHQLLQALIELARAGSEERALLESITKHIGMRTGTPTGAQLTLGQSNSGEGER